MSDVLDFHLDDLGPANADSEYAERQFWAGDLTILAEHNATPNGSHSYVVAHDGSVTWGVPGQPQVAAIKVARDLSLNTFTFELTYHANMAFAQNWLIEHGCPPERITQTGGDLMKPADDLTARIEQQIREAGTRYEVLDSQTSDYDPCETWTLTRDSSAAQAPIRVFLEEGDFGAHTYTMREGAFTDEDAARHWLDDRSSPLPQPPEYCGDTTALRTHAALTRSSGASAIPKAGLDGHSAPSAGPAQRPSAGRST
ncbi:MULTISPECIES: glycosyl hydrolase [unclassified Streptomyces]|uniref:glycosyl hydrolase n=1 Tax=unclassified Streptomyces TaxID=2593676 RepID=UPI000939B7A6|nr:glycosyl hydrolase [Streptomyces sp. TSRI0281]OKI45289.1 glycosyl hydrolase [Streptomyces sp. TSRI0281]